MKILAIETFYGGAHRAFMDGVIEHSSHEYTLITLPDELWKWRLKTGALEIAKQIKDQNKFDLIFVTDLINLADLKALLGRSTPPVVLYYHENQHSYPPEEGRSADFHTRWIDFSNALIADQLLYNSHFQLNSFLNALPRFFREIPENSIEGDSMIEDLRSKSAVIYPGTESPVKAVTTRETPRRILWNHRWEYDKQPKQFLRVLIKLMKMDIPFELVLLGESQKFPSDIYEKQIDELQSRIVHRGFLESREDYFEMLSSCDIMVSCSNQENFGLSVVESIMCGCFPLLPNRLAYPEVLPDEYHKSCLYYSEKELVYRLSQLLTKEIPEHSDLPTLLQQHQWQKRICEFDELFERVQKKEQ